MGTKSLGIVFAIGFIMVLISILSIAYGDLEFLAFYMIFPMALGFIIMTYSAVNLLRKLSEYLKS